MQLHDLLDKSVKDLTIEELEEGLMLLKKLRVFSEGGKKGSKNRPSNAERQLKDLLEKMPKDKLAEVMKLLEKEE